MSERDSTEVETDHETPAQTNWPLIVVGLVLGAFWVGVAIALIRWTR